LIKCKTGLLETKICDQNQRCFGFTAEGKLKKKKNKEQAGMDQARKSGELQAKKHDAELGKELRKRRPRNGTNWEGGRGKPLCDSPQKKATRKQKDGRSAPGGLKERA